MAVDGLGRSSLAIACAAARYAARLGGLLDPVVSQRLPPGASFRRRITRGDCWQDLRRNSVAIVSGTVTGHVLPPAYSGLGGGLSVSGG